ncbi:MAG: hypothetical protein QXL33_07795 [Sulfolobaceae archaeon]
MNRLRGPSELIILLIVAIAILLVILKVKRVIVFGSFSDEIYPPVSTAFILLKLDRKYLQILEKIIDLQEFTVYSAYRIVDIPVTTLWRMLKKMENMALLYRAGKYFTISPKGLVILYYYHNDPRVKEKAIGKLSNIWQLSSEDVKRLLDFVLKYLQSRSISPLLICYNQLMSVIMILPEELKRSEEIQDIIAKIYLKTFPVISSNGCEGVILESPKGKELIAVKCKYVGYKLNHKCKILECSFNGKKE